MRIFLLYLLLVFPAAFIGFLRVAVAPRVNYRCDVAYNDARSIMLGIITSDEYGDQSGGRLSDAILDRWLARNLTNAELAEYSLFDPPPLDPWGCRYRFLRDADLPFANLALSPDGSARHEHDGHMNEASHQLVADALFAILRDRGVVHTDSSE